METINTRYRIHVSLIFLLALLVSCDEIEKVTNTNKAIKKIVISDTVVSLKKTESKKLIATAYDKDGGKVSVENFGWINSAPTVVSINSEGNLVAKADGLAGIVAEKDNVFSDTTHVVVGDDYSKTVSRPYPLDIPDSIAKFQFESSGIAVFVPADVFKELKKHPNKLSDSLWNEFVLKYAAYGKKDAIQQNKSWTYTDPNTDCVWEVTIIVSSRINEVTPSSGSADDGVNRWFLAVGGFAHNANVQTPKSGVGVNCFSNLWDKTVIAYGIAIIDYSVVWRQVNKTSKPCEFSCSCVAEAGAYYYSKSEADTWVGFWSPFCTRISNSYAVDRAQAKFNGSSLFEETAGAQSGDEVQTSISVEMGGGISKEEGASVSASVGQSETRTKNEGTSEDFINAFNEASSNDCKGYVFLNSGGKSYAKHEGRAGSSSQVITTSGAVYLFVNVPNCGGSGTGLVISGGCDSEQVRKDRARLIKPFFEKNGIKDFPK